MNVIFINTGPKNHPNVGTHLPYMEPMGREYTIIKRKKGIKGPHWPTLFNIVYGSDVTNVSDSVSCCCLKRARKQGSRAFADLASCSEKPGIMALEFPVFVFLGSSLWSPKMISGHPCPFVVWLVHCNGALHATTLQGARKTADRSSPGRY